MLLKQIIIDSTVEILRRSATKLPKPVMDAMVEIKNTTNDEGALLQIQNIVDDAFLAMEESKPMCQDTGIISFTIEVGDHFPFKSELKDILKEATIQATTDIPLRPNVVDFFNGNSGNNIDSRGFLPYFYIDLIPGNDVKITAMTKGGGSSNVSKLGMLKPGLGLKGALQFVIETVAEAGPSGCPPYRVGVGIGGGEDICMTLAKKSLLKPIGYRNTDHKIAELEEALMKACNELPIGPMGVGAGKTVIDVNINLAGRHPASLPVGVVLSCWALRHSSVKITAEGDVEFTEY